MKIKFSFDPLQPVLLLLWLTFSATHVKAGVLEVHVGITPNCPHGVSACWPGAGLAIQELEDVEMVASDPDAYNCTARVWLKGDSLPDPNKWKEKFQSRVGESYVFRGVEVTVSGSVEEKGGRLFLSWPGLEKPIALEKLENKLQWNYKKASARGPEPEEARAFEDLSAEVRKAASKPLKVQLTGPLKLDPNGPALEVREFFVATRYAKSQSRD